MRVVAKVDPDGVTYFGADQWPQDSKVLPFRGPGLKAFKRRIGVFAINSLVIDSVPHRACTIVFRGLKPRQTGQIAAMRSVVPIHFICGNEIDSHLTGLSRKPRRPLLMRWCCSRMLRLAGEARESEQQHGKNGSNMRTAQSVHLPDVTESTSRTV